MNFQRDGLTTQLRRARVESLWAVGERVLDGQDYLDYSGGETDKRHEDLYLQAKKFGLSSIANPPRWLQRSLRSDWLEGEVLRPGGKVGLNTMERKVFALAFLGGLGQQEIGAILGRDWKTVRNLKQIIKRKLKKYADRHNLPEVFQTYE